MSSKVTPAFLGKIINGKLVLENREKLSEYIRGLAGEVVVQIHKRRKLRSLKQNRYYWGCVIPLMSESLGYSDEEMHQALKMKFLLKRGVVLNTIRSTSTLNSLEFGEYLDKCVQLAAEHDINIPDPQDYYEKRD